MINTVCVIGLGVVGGAVFDELRKGCDSRKVYGVDLRQEVLDHLCQMGVSREHLFSSIEGIPDCDLYSVCVYTCQQVVDVVTKLHESGRLNTGLLVIESTIDQTTADWLKRLACLENYDVVMMPHRMMPGDNKHQVFNLIRVIGAEGDRALQRALNFYLPIFYSRGGDLHKTTWEVAVLSKLLDNSYRYLQIAFAEELKLTCKACKIDFDQLRAASNTKWNINILEARSGIGGTCLPKDIELLLRTFPGFHLLIAAKLVDVQYRHSLET